MSVYLPPRPRITSGVIWIVCDWLNNFCCFSLAIDTVDGCGLNNEMHYRLQPKKTKVMLY